MRKREPLLIHMEILAALSASPKGPTRLAQACNVNYGRIDSFTGALVAKGLIRTGVEDGQEVFMITEEGYSVYKEWLEIWRKLPLD
ncbi:MAG TPA: winged helix-turn-helix domain-containing protein [Nitrososphaerales archaeon]|nr:winged helix-turn-helix domain-containing protein [Nitrososphaerales archaeon]